MTGSLFWKQRFLGDEDFVPGAIYMDLADVDGDGINDLLTVGEPHFEEPDLPLTVLKLGVYYLNRDFTVRETEIIDAGPRQTRRSTARGAFGSSSTAARR